MIVASLGGAILLLVTQAQPSPARGGVAAAAAEQVRFAPPVDRPMTYRVATRRIGRDGSLINFALVYDLRWQRAGRGYRLEAVLQRIDSDARPEVTRALTSMLQPLVGEQTAYLVAPDGRRVELVDPDGLWERVTARIEATGAEAGRAQARQVAQMIAALPAAERDRLVTADIRALIVPANAAIPAATLVDVSATHDGARRTVARIERAAAAAQPLEIDNLWTIDTDTGLVVREQRQSWIVAAGADGRTLVEERVRALEPAP